MSDSLPTVTRRQVLAFRLGRHGLLDAAPEATRTFATAPVLDLGVPDSGTDGGLWALANRSIDAGDTDGGDIGIDDLVGAWTLRGAPHLYRRVDVAAVATATAPLSETDARKRVFDASKPLIAAGIDVLDALVVVATELREIVVEPTPKGEVSTELTARLPDPYLRFCRPCDTTHIYEQPFRLAALQAGLELVPGTSPPVLRRIAGFDPPNYSRAGTEADARHDILRAQLRLTGPVRQAETAKVADSPARDIARHWPGDTVEVVVADEEVAARAKPRFVLEEDLDELRSAAETAPTGARLLGVFDPYLQLQDRELLAPDAARRKDLWRVLGRPGAIVDDGEIVGTWRPRAKGRTLTVTATAWTELSTRTRRRVEAQAERLAAHRGVALAGVGWD
jgi:hypothetical protein